MHLIDVIFPIYHIFSIQIPFDRSTIDLGHNFSNLISERDARTVFHSMFAMVPAIFHLLLHR